MTSRQRFWFVTFFALLAASCTASLGFWQLGRATTKIVLQTALEQRRSLPELDVKALEAFDQGVDLLHRRVAVRGHWLGDKTVYLDNRQMKGRPGFYVFTPLQLENSRAVVLVQRGWVPRSFTDRSQLPPVETPAGTRSVQGEISAAPARLYALGADGVGMIRQNLDLAQFRAETSLPLLDLVLRETGPSSEGLERDWPAVNAGVDKHYGYAFQWFGLTALITLLYVWFQIVRRFLPRARV